MIDFNNSRLNRRIGIVVNYTSLFTALYVFSTGISAIWTLRIGIPIWVLFGISWVSFHFVYHKTGIWKQVHSNRTALGSFHSEIAELDERQTWVVHEAIRYAYTSISFVSFLIILFYPFISESFTSGLTIGIALMYLAQSLPCAIIAWRENRV